ncbi:MAG: hypothetical protein COB04_19500 [Gammaproteobacteria bacterium]|nr:MAG: hypothetical protein COB04_19500 [Gammaproteobacteria bacterium]
MPDVQFIKGLPGRSIPDLGGQSLDNRDGTLIEIEHELEFLSVDEGAIEVALADDLVVRYLIMARADFNDDGVEDVLLRLDWYVSSAFGKGFDLLMLTKTAENSKLALIWRR